MRSDISHVADAEVGGGRDAILKSVYDYLIMFFVISVSQSFLLIKPSELSKRGVSDPHITALSSVHLRSKPQVPMEHHCCLVSPSCGLLT